MKNADAATGRYSAALVINPKIASSPYGRGLAELIKGDKPKSAAGITAATAIDPKIVSKFARWGVLPPHSR